jgi:hypothetical protein
MFNLDFERDEEKEVKDHVIEIDSSASFAPLSFFLLIEMSQGKLANRRSIALSGSTKVVSEFFEYAVNSCVLIIM